MTPFTTLASCITGKTDDACTGYPVGNFGIAAEITPNGRVFSRILYNPPVLGSGLEELARGEFMFSCDGVELADTDFENRQVSRLFPEATAAYSDSRMPGLLISASFLAPIKAYDALPCSIPALLADFELANDSDTEKRTSATFKFYLDINPDKITMINSGGFWLIGTAKTKIGFNGPISWKGINGGIQVTCNRIISPRSKSKLRFILACHDPAGFYADLCPDIPALAEHISTNWDQFALDRAEFIGLLPRTHDDQVNRYLRWYLAAGILLTRITRKHVLTMGYCELNQRDSFWTSWPHLVLWPDLERRMIEESAEFQRDNGKIPTTVLSLIDRADDIDINEYFNLRIARYYEWTGDLDFVSGLWPSFKRSMAYLESMDKDHDGYLDQCSYWGDWKDVWGVEGRKAAPHFEFLWLAVLRSAKELAKKLHDTDAAKRYTELYERSCAVINADISDGGLWNGSFYTTLWYDGREDNHVQEDQFVGPLYGVVPRERISSIWKSLEPNMTDWGVRDTYPYRERFSHEGGDYHNGGVWPFLNFADAFARFVTGYPEGGWQILKRVGEWDFEKWGDYMPAEFLNGNTGENDGKPIQAWNADYHAAVLFGALGVKMLSPTKVQIAPRIPDTESFETAITIPHGTLDLKQSAAGSLTIEIKSNLRSKITIRYGAMTSKSGEASTSEQIGACSFQFTEFTLNPGQTKKLAF